MKFVIDRLNVSDVNVFLYSQPMGRFSQHRAETLVAQRAELTAFLQTVGHKVGTAYK